MIKLYTTKENIDKNKADPFEEKYFMQITPEYFSELLKQHGDAAYENVFIKSETIEGKCFFRKISVVLEQATEDVFRIYGSSFAMRYE